MRKELILSRLRTELRRKRTAYRVEKRVMRWGAAFIEKMSIEDSSQIRLWQGEYYLLLIDEDVNFTQHDVKEAGKALNILFNDVLRFHHDMDLSGNRGENGIEPEPGILMITG